MTKSNPFHFLFLFSDTGGGHRACAEAVREALHLRYGEEVVVTMVDVFRASHRFPFDHFPELWPVATRARGVPWGLFYHLSNHPLFVRTAHAAVWPYVRNSLLALLYQYPADVIVSFHGIPNLSLLWAWKRLEHRPPMVSVTQDLVTVHASFFPPGFTLYFVPTEEARARAIAWGVSPERIRAIGNPVRPSVVRDASLSPQEARRKLGLGDGLWLLITGGGDGIGGMMRLLARLARRRPGINVAVITGRNRALRQRLMATRLPLNLRVEGFVERMGLWLRAADIIVTKAGPNTLSEIFIAERPSIIYMAIPGQESGNVTFAVSHGAAMWAPSPRATVQAVMTLLDDVALRERMARAAASLARPQAADEVARTLYQMAEAG